jgi:leader peptidase (prepilin peptidase)/N-methyltransferase
MAIFSITLFGLIIGSFLNVCIYRVPRKLSVARPMRSYCPKCETTLKAWENIPLLSWLMLRGKCRTCAQPISGQYPLVELLSAIAAAQSYLRFGLTPTGVVIYCLTAALLVITFIDFEFKIIPNVISYPGITLGLILGAVSQYTQVFELPLTQSAWDSLVGMYAGGGFFYLIGWGYYLATKDVGLGGGDIKLMGMTGAILGWHSVAPTIFAGSLLGSIVGIGTIIFGGGTRKSEIPFGPWLSLGAILYIFTDFGWFRLPF